MVVNSHRSQIVTERTETGEKGVNRSNINDNNLPIKNKKALEVPVGRKISHEDERDSDDDSAEEEDGYYEPLQEDDITMIPKTIRRNSEDRNSS